MQGRKLPGPAYLIKGVRKMESSEIARAFITIHDIIYPQSQQIEQVFTGGNVGRALLGAYIGDAIKEHAKAVNKLASAIESLQTIKVEHENSEQRTESASDTIQRPDGAGDPGRGKDADEADNKGTV